VNEQGPGLFTEAMLIFHKKACEYMLVAFGGITLILINILATNDLKNGVTSQQIKTSIILSICGFISASCCFIFVYVGDARAKMDKNTNIDSWAAHGFLQISAIFLIVLVYRTLSDLGAI